MILDGFPTLMLAMQKICLLCPRLFCVVLQGVLLLKVPTRRIKNVVSMQLYLISLLDAQSSQACQMISSSRVS
ncbi:hypothetical protein F4604DRAFT_1766858 [Suillus subluteus]|nr:hypothetical protein F4604DRAFT_1766858 [Suillus subluteus]